MPGKIRTVATAAAAAVAAFEVVSLGEHPAAVLDVEMDAGKQVAHGLMDGLTGRCA
jgi:hypothetical protein